jgi:hypothetical protein
VAANSSNVAAPGTSGRPCVVGCLLDLDAGAMTVFVAGKPLEVQCEYRFPKDGRAWYPSVSGYDETLALHSCAF